LDWTPKKDSLFKEEGESLGRPTKLFAFSTIPPFHFFCMRVRACGAGRGKAQAATPEFGTREGKLYFSCAKKKKK
jgi:hypothetical protein